MEAIEFLIELDFDEPISQRTNIMLNQANENSIVFHYKIYKGANEINYFDYSRAEVVFQKKDGLPVIDDATITSDDITYQLNPHIFDLPGIVRGQINLYTEDSLTATLHYVFTIIPDLAATIPFDSQAYIGQISRLIAELKEELNSLADDAKESIGESVNRINEIVAEAQRILEGLQGEAFATEEFVLDKAAELGGRIDIVDSSLNQKANLSGADFFSLRRGGHMVWDAGNHPVESGIWTPKSISGLTITQVGGSLYCRMGDMCFCYMDLSIGPYIGDNPIAQAILSGIPYPNVWPPYAALFLGYGGQGVSGIIGPGGTINLTLDGRYMTNSETDRFTQIIFSFSYKISQ